MCNGHAACWEHQGPARDLQGLLPPQPPPPASQVPLLSRPDVPTHSTRKPSLSDGSSTGGLTPPFRTAHVFADSPRATACTRGPEAFSLQVPSLLFPKSRPPFMRRQQDGWWKAWFWSHKTTPWRCDHKHAISLSASARQ